MVSNVNWIVSTGLALAPHWVEKEVIVTSVSVKEAYVSTLPLLVRPTRIVAESRYVPAMRWPHKAGSALAASSVSVNACKLGWPPLAPSMEPALPPAAGLVAPQE